MPTKKVAAKKTTPTQKCIPVALKSYTLHITDDVFGIKARRPLQIPHDTELSQYLALTPMGGFAATNNTKKSRFTNIHLNWAGLLNQDGQPLKSKAWVVRRMKLLVDAGWSVDHSV